MAALALNFGQYGLVDRRDSERDEVFYRTRAIARAGTVPLQIVNISASGFMARSEAEIEAGELITVRLPILGSMLAEVRWALGGRIGCQFERVIDLAPYLQLLSELVKHTR